MPSWEKRNSVSTWSSIPPYKRQAVTQDNKTQPFSPESHLQTVIFFR